MKIKNLVLSSTAALALFAISTTVANADTYTVKAGDTVSAIAKAHNTSVSTIEKANKLANVNLIFVGDKLEVNGTTATTTTSAATSAAPQSATSQATASTATSASATSASSQSVASQASSSAASQATSSVATSAASSASSTQSAASQASSSAATTSQASSNTTSSAASSTSSTTSSYNGSNMQSYVLSQMESRTGVSASQWNTIITRESNWNSSVKNSTSGAYGLFQNMHISSGSVQDQVNAAVNLYNAQGMSAWAL
ncbi:LysM peptidoglycan-binding domain-containing protein [Lactiplantibacillus sp. DA1]|uniref:LysM peptidoglycan-binding domain-containing protein n=1 Tax=Lactiplantibacillus sp. DA1 TaxID=3079857 RepID=UPI00292A5F99|nr:LysM peptidoglycan-binding domain-containing protein [Lactiplantibacillus sp. DA1]MDV0431553.1 LysM peptidoglycan-binding domain-containing protein [Lactiplantibacillus sp. DA1]